MINLLLQIGATAIAIGIAALVSTNLGDFRFSGPTLVYIVVIGSLFPIWMKNVSTGNRFLGWLFGSSVGLVVFLGSRIYAFSLGKTGSFNLAMGLLGFGILLGFLLPLWVSYLVCRRKTQPNLSTLPSVYSVLPDEIKKH